MDTHPTPVPRPPGGAISFVALAQLLQSRDFTAARSFVEQEAGKGAAPEPWSALLERIGADERLHITHYYALADLAGEDVEEADRILAQACAAYPHLAGPMLRRLELLTARGQTAAALAMARDFLARTPGDLHAVITYGRLSAAETEPGASRAVLSAAIAAGHAGPNLIGPWCDAALARKEPAGCREALAICASASPDEPASAILATHEALRAALHITHFYTLADLAEAAGERREAIAILEQARLALPQFAGPAQKLADLHLLAGDSTAAMRALISFLRGNPCDVGVALQLTRAPIDPAFEDERQEALFSAFAAGAKAENVIAARMNALIDRGEFTQAWATVQRLAAPLGLPMLADQVWDEALAASEGLARALDVSSYFRLAMSLRRRGLIRRALDLLGQACARFPENPDAWINHATMLLENGAPGAALRSAQTALDAFPGHAELLTVRARAYSALGEREAMKADIAAAEEAIDRDSRGRDKAPALRAQLDWLSVHLDVGDLIARYPVAASRVGVVAVLAQRSPFVLLWLAPILCVLRSRGYETVFLDCASVRAHPLDEGRLRALDGMIEPYGLAFRDEAPTFEPDADWIVDPAARRLSRAGFDIHQAVAERVATTQRVYRAQPGPVADEVRRDAMIRSEVAIGVCERLADYARATGERILVASSMTHYAPACVYKQFCARPEIGTLINYVEINSGYEQYRSNDMEAEASSISVANLTLNPNQRTSIHCSRRAFEQWLARGSAHIENTDELDALLSANRAGALETPEAAEVLKRIRAHRRGGGKVLCLFGKITYDIAVEKEGGPAHADMADWLNHTIDTLAGRADTLLLIKPHPYEIRKSVADPNEFFADLIEGDLPDNCIFLDHRWFNIATLVPHLDAGLIWHGTATLELLAQGVPVVVGAEWGVRDFPIETTTPSDRADYERMLIACDVESVSPERRARARHLLEYLVSDEVVIPFPYAQLHALRNSSGKRVGLRPEAVRDFLENGDRRMEFAADMCEFGIGRLDDGVATQNAANEERDA